MPTVPTYQRQASIPGQIPYGPGSLLVAGLPGATLYESGDVISREAEHRLEARRVNDLTQYTLEATKDFDELDRWVSDQTEWDKIQPGYESKLSELRTKYQERITDPAVKSLFNRDFQKMALRASAEVRGVAKKREKDSNKANLESTTLEYQDLIGKSTNFGAATEHIKNGLAAIEGARAAGTIDNVEAVKYHEHFINQAALNFVKTESLTNPGQARKSLESFRDELNINPAIYAAMAEEFQSKEEAARRKAEAEENKRKALRRGELKDKMQDNLASIQDLGKELSIRESEIDDVFDPVDAKEYREKRALAWQYHGIWAGLKNAPPDEATKILDSVRPKEATSGYRNQEKLYDSLARSYAAERSVFERDPAAYVSQMPEVKTPEDSLRMQEYLGAIKPKILSKNQAESIKAQYQKAGPKEKIGLVQTLNDQFGKYNTQVLTELDLSYDHLYAAGLPPVKAERVIQVLDMKDQDFGLSPETKNTISKNAKTTFYETKSMGGVLAKIAEITGNAEYSKMAKGMEEITTRTAWLNRDQDPGIAKTVKDLWGEYNFIADEDLGYAWFPKEFDKGEMETKLKGAREKIDPFIRHKRKQFATQELFDEYARDLKSRGLWVPSPQEDGFVLVDPVTGRIVTRKDGRSIKMHWSGYITR